MAGIDGLTLSLNIVALAVGAAIACIVALYAFFHSRRKSKTGAADAATPAGASSPVKPTPNIYIVQQKSREMSDNLGSFLWFWICVGAIITAPLLLALTGTNIFVAVIFFGIFPIVGTVAGYIFHRYRVSGPARDFDKILKTATGIGLHIGTDDKARLVGARRGSTGRWHFPNMEITADAVRKAIFPFYGSVLTIIHSVSDSQLNPEFLYFATMLNRNSELIGDDGRPKLSTDIADTIVRMSERESELLDMAEQQVRIKNGETNLAQVLDERYRSTLYPDGVKLDTDASDKLTEYWKGMMKDEGWPMKIELAELARGFEVTLEEKGYHIEYERDMTGRLIGGHLVHDRVIDLHDFRNYLPTGGTAESSHLASENARLAGQEEQGVTQQKWMRWVILLLTPVMVGVCVYMIFLGVKQLDILPIIQMHP